MKEYPINRTLPFSAPVALGFVRAESEAAALALADVMWGARVHLSIAGFGYAHRLVDSVADMNAPEGGWDR